jgi:hypothetical protein
VGVSTAPGRFGPRGQPGLGHALAQAAFLEEGLLRVSELTLQKVARYLDEAEDDVGGNRRVDVLNALAEGLVGRVRYSVELS